MHPPALAGGGFFAEGGWAFLGTTQPGVTSPSQPSGFRQVRQPQAGTGGGIGAREEGCRGTPGRDHPGALLRGAQAAAVQLRLAEVGQVQPCGAQGERSAPALHPGTLRAPQCCTFPAACGCEGPREALGYMLTPEALLERGRARVYRAP